MDALTVNSKLLSPTGDKPLTPAMVTALWVIGDEIDRRRIKSDLPKDSGGLWLEIPAARLRGEAGRPDNLWLKECLDRMQGLKISGDWKGEPWGAVIVAQWHIEQHGSLVRLLIPPAAINAIRAPETFAKIEAFAAYKLEGHARRLYAALADKKRMTNQHYWVFGVDELRSILDVSHKKSYDRWNNFRQWVLDPAITQINDFGTVTIKMTPEKAGRSIRAVRIDWQWKTIDEARETEAENEKPDMARRQPDTERIAPPLLVGIRSDDLPPAKTPKTEEEKAAVAEIVQQVRRNLVSHKP